MYDSIKRASLPYWSINSKIVDTKCLHHPNDPKENSKMTRESDQWCFISCGKNMIKPK